MPTHTHKQRGSQPTSLDILYTRWYIKSSQSDNNDNKTSDENKMWVNDRVIFLVEEKEERIQQDKKKNRNSIYNSCKNHIMINDTNWNAYNVETTTVWARGYRHIYTFIIVKYMNLKE